MLFFTTMQAQTLMNETFSGTSLPAGWSITTTAPNPEENWNFYDDYDDLEVYESSTVAQNEWLNLPAVDLQSYSTMFFNFSLWLYNKNSYITNKSSKASVVLSNDNGVSWTEVWNSETLNGNDFDGPFLYERIWSINLSPYCGAGKPPVKIAFKYTTNGSKPSSALSYAALLRTNISSMPITSFSDLKKNVLNWYPVNNFSGTYDIYYGPLGDTPEKAGGTLVSGLSGTSFTFPENYCQYSAFVRTNDGTPGEWVKLNFLNEADNIMATSSSNSSEINWSGNAASYDLEYGAGNFAIGTGTRVSNISATTYNINNLLPNTSYKVIIKASCNTATWRTLNFTTNSLGAVEMEKAPLDIFPNPASDVLNFSEEVKNITILDQSGRILQSYKDPANKIDISQLSKGNYIISATIKSGERITKKIIKK